MIRIIAAGKLRDRHLAALVADYIRRIRRLAPFAMEEVRDGNPDQEAEAMLRRVGSPQGTSRLVALDERGRPVTSRELAQLLGRHGALTFLVGGAEGLGEAARSRAYRILRLSRLTLTHEMARLLLVEQIYRGLTILRNMPYHRGGAR
jgi:23S rRNA (pseudouridine1915-N3)-methyltransferase